MKRVLILSLLAILALAVALSSVAMADTLHTYGDAAVVSMPGTPSPHPAQPYVFQFTSNPSGPDTYGGLYVSITGALTPSTVTSLSAEYLMTQGAFGGGAPRFSLWDTTTNCGGDACEAYLYWGTPLGGGSFSDPNGPANTQWGNTGNYADLLSSDLRVYSNGFGGDNNPNTGVTWAQFLATPGVAGTQIGDISLDLDGGFTGAQQLDVSSFEINGQQYNAPTPEPSTLLLLGSGVVGMAGILRRKIIG